MNIYQIYEKYHRDFLNFARSITNNHDRAFDLVQEAYLKGLDNEEVFQTMNEYQIKAWFFTTIKNKNIDSIRKDSRLIPLEDEGFLESPDIFEEQVAVRDMLDKLPEKYKNIIVMKYQMKLNATEIGEMMNLSPSTVRTHLSAALKMLRENI